MNELNTKNDTNNCNSIPIEIAIDKEYINNKIYFLDNIKVTSKLFHDNLKELNEDCI